MASTDTSISRLAHPHRGHLVAEEAVSVEAGAAQVHSRAEVQMALTSKKVEWEEVPTRTLYVYRLKAKGGWLVKCNEGLTFLPDPEHEWDGGSVD